MKYIVNTDSGKLVGPFAKSEGAVSYIKTMLNGAGRLYELEEPEPTIGPFIPVAHDELAHAIDSICNIRCISKFSTFSVISSMELLQAFERKLVDAYGGYMRVSVPSLSEAVAFIARATHETAGFDPAEFADDLIENMWPRLPKIETIDECEEESK